MEQYQIIKNFENYSISNFGNVQNNKTGRILKSYINTKGYHQIRINKKTVEVHRLVALTFLDNPEFKKEVDHIDNNKLNNYLSNLRWATRTENRRNCNIYKNNTSGYKGIIFIDYRNKWKAYLSIDNKHIHLGYFDNLDDAIKIRMRKVNEIFGDYVHISEKI